MATDTAPVTRQVLTARDTHAWRTYGEACHDWRVTPDERRQRFEDAMEALEALHDFDMAERGVPAP
jgi:hypothetical protein